MTTQLEAARANLSRLLKRWQDYPDETTRELCRTAMDVVRMLEKGGYGKSEVTR